MSFENIKRHPQSQYSYQPALADKNLDFLKKQQIQQRYLLEANQYAQHLDDDILPTQKQRSKILQTNPSPEKPPLVIGFSQNAVRDINQQSLQRLLSEESSKERLAQRQSRMKDNIKIGFQENLNKKLTNGLISKQNGNNQLNKAAVNSYHDSSSTKYNSYLMKSFWLLTSIRSKRVQDIVQNRQQNCLFCNQINLQNSMSNHQGSCQAQSQHDFLKQLVRQSLDKKYLTSQDYYNSKIVSDIMYNENRHIVSVFKDYLIFDDFSEYLKRFYRNQESIERLPRVYEFYEKYSKVFPNYVVLPENKYMFKNIERKQKLIDEKHQLFLERQEQQKREQEEANALGLAINSSFIQRMRLSKNQIFGSQFINDLTDMEQSQSLMRQQSSKIFDMIQLQHNIPLGNQMMNDFMKQTHNQSRNKEALNFENLINKLIQYDKNDDQSRNINWNQEFPNDKFDLNDINISLSSHAMSSFLHDFDITKGQNQQTLRPLGDNESYFCADTPMNRSLTVVEVSKQIAPQINRQANQTRVQQHNNPNREKANIKVEVEKTGKLIIQLNQKQQQKLQGNYQNTSINSSKHMITQQNNYIMIDHRAPIQNRKSQISQLSSQAQSQSQSLQNANRQMKSTKINNAPQSSQLQQKQGVQIIQQTQGIQKKPNQIISQISISSSQVQFTGGNISPNHQFELVSNVKDKRFFELPQTSQMSSSSLRSGQSQLNHHNLINGGRTSQISLNSNKNIISSQSQNLNIILAQGTQSQQKLLQSTGGKQTPLSQIPTSLKQMTVVKNQRNAPLDQLMNGSSGFASSSTISKKTNKIFQNSGKMMQTQQSSNTSQILTQKVESQSFVNKVGQSPIRQSPQIDFQASNIVKGKNGDPSYQKVANTKKLQLDNFNREENSKSFKSSATAHLTSSVHGNDSATPQMISQSIRDAVNKLLPPQPQSTKVQKTKIESISEQVSQQQANLKMNSVKMSTNALLNKLFTQQQQLQKNPKQVYTPQASSNQQFAFLGSMKTFNNELAHNNSHTQQTGKVVYSTRSPHKKNFSSPNENIQINTSKIKSQKQITKKSQTNSMQRDQISENIQLISREDVMRKSAAPTAGGFSSQNYVQFNKIDPSMAYQNMTGVQLSYEAGSLSQLADKFNKSTPASQTTQKKIIKKAKNFNLIEGQLSPTNQFGNPEFNKTMTTNLSLGFGTSPTAYSAASRTMDKRERGGSEKNQQEKTQPNFNNGLQIIPENIYSIKGSIQTSGQNIQRRPGGGYETSMGIITKGPQGKRNQSNQSSKSGQSQKSNTSNASSTSNPYTKISANSSAQVSLKKKLNTKTTTSSFGGGEASVQQQISFNLKENKSNQLYEKIKNANTNKKKLATIFTFNK